MDQYNNYYYQPGHSGPPPQSLPPQQAQMIPVMQNAGAQQGPLPPPQTHPSQQAQIISVMQNAGPQQGPPPTQPGQQVVHGGQRQQMMGGAGPPPQQQLGPQQSQHVPPPQLQHPNHHPPTQHHHQQQHLQHQQQQVQHQQHPQHPQHQHQQQHQQHHHHQQQHQHQQQQHQQQQHHHHQQQQQQHQQQQHQHQHQQHQQHQQQQQHLQQHQGPAPHQQPHHHHHHHPQHHPHQPQQQQGPHPHQIGGPPMNVVGGHPPPHHPQQGPPPPQQPIPPHNMTGPPQPPPPGILQTEFRILEMNRRLQSRVIINRQSVTPLPTPPQYEESLWWERFANDFFEDDATITLSIPSDQPPTRYTIGRTLIPRFFRSYFEGGVIDLQINLRHPKETLHTSHTSLDCDQTTIVTHIQTSQQAAVVCTSGHLLLDFINGMIRSWNFTTRGYREYVERPTMAPQDQQMPRPVTRQGLTNSTLMYLKMCVILEPMQEVMLAHKQTNLEPRECLKHILSVKYNRIVENRSTTSKRRKRKPSNPAGAVGTNKKKNANSINNNNITTPSEPPFVLASQEVMTVGEPSMMGGDFGDDNERLITRMENNQYDPSASTPNNMNDGSLSPSLNTTPDRGNGGPNSLQSPHPPAQQQKIEYKDNV